MKFKVLYDTMYDDLKDAEMLIDYAYELRDMDCYLSEEIAKYALERYNHFLNFHRVFQKEIEKETQIDKVDVLNCLWESTHNHYLEWGANIKFKIDKY